MRYIWTIIQGSRQCLSTGCIKHELDLTLFACFCETSLTHPDFTDERTGIRGTECLAPNITQLATGWGHLTSELQRRFSDPAAGVLPRPLPHPAPLPTLLSLWSRHLQHQHHLGESVEMPTLRPQPRTTDSGSLVNLSL